MAQDPFEISIEKSEKTRIKISIDYFKGKTLINIRNWYFDVKSNEFKPTPKGVAIDIKYLDELIYALNEAKKSLFNTKEI